MDPLRVYPPLPLSCPPSHRRPSSTGLLLLLVSFGVFFFSTASRLVRISLSPSHPSPALNDDAADADVNSTWDEVYTLIRYSRFFPIPPGTRIRERNAASIRWRDSADFNDVNWPNYLRRIYRGCLKNAQGICNFIN